MGITVVVPTVGRESLKKTLVSLGWQRWRKDDQILIVGDGRQDRAREMVQSDSRFTYVEVPGPGNSWGHSVRNEVNRLGLATGSHIVNLDDDDILVQDAVSTICEEIEKTPNVPLLFQMDARNRGLGFVWSKPWGIVDRNVSSACIVTPNVKEKLGRWDETKYNGDLSFVQETVGLYSGAVRWVPFVTTICRPGPV